MSVEHFLPYDYTRCDGTSNPVCSDCLRKLSPWREHWQSVFLKPPLAEDETCKKKISWSNYDQ